MATETVKDTKKQVIELNDELWNELIEASDGAVAMCYQCGTCSAICPWEFIKLDSSYNIRKIIRNAQCDIYDNQEVWQCTTCGQCEVSCPHGVPIVKIIQTLKNYAFKNREAPEEFNSIFWALFWDGNPYKLPPSNRGAWTKNGALSEYNDKKEFLVYFGNEYSFEQRSIKTARALLSLFKKAEVSFGAFGEKETCLGSVAKEIGHAAYFNEIKTDRTKTLDELSVETIVTISPHDYDVLKNDYQINGEVKHVLEVIKDLIDSGRLKLSREVNRTVAYHDPCYLGRRNDIYDLPRDILEAVPGINLVEFPNTRDNALCCGGGGGRMWLETPPEERFSNQRLKEAADIEVNSIITSCPYCVINFEDSAKYLKMKDCQVLEVIELVNMAAE